MNNLEHIHKKLNSLSGIELEIFLHMLDEYLSAEAGMKEVISASPDGFQKMMATSFLTRRIMGPFAKAMIVEIGDELYAVDPEDHVVGWELRYNGAFSPGQLSMIKGLVGQDARVLVVGAHIGTLAIPLAKVCSKVVAIEANPQSFQLLALNVHLNQLTNCEIHNIAANDVKGDIPFLQSRVNSGGSKRRPVVRDHMYYYDNPVEIFVSGYPLDEYLEDQQFDIIIMDIEGSEYFALKGMSKLISTARYLILEFLPHHFRNVAGIGIGDLLAILPGYESLYIPSLDKKVSREEFLRVLTGMYDNDSGDEGLIFERK